MPRLFFILSSKRGSLPAEANPFPRRKAIASQSLSVGPPSPSLRQGSGRQTRMSSSFVCAFSRVFPVRFEIRARGANVSLTLSRGAKPKCRICFLQTFSGYISLLTPLSKARPLSLPSPFPPWERGRGTTAPAAVRRGGGRGFCTSLERCAIGVRGTDVCLPLVRGGGKNL